MSIGWIAFLAPFVLWMLSSWSWRVRHPGSYNLQSLARGRTVLFFAAGVIVGIWCLARLPSAINAASLYFGDPSCTAGTADAQRRPGAPCRTERVAIQQARTVNRGRNGTRYYLALERTDGSHLDVQVRSSGGSVWNAAASTPGLLAHMQSFRGRPVLVTTDAGAIRTYDFPSDVLERYQFFGMFALGLIAAALVESIFSWQALF